MSAEKCCIFSYMNCLKVPNQCRFGRSVQDNTKRWCVSRHFCRLTSDCILCRLRVHWNSLSFVVRRLFTAIQLTYILMSLRFLSNTVATVLGISGAFLFFRYLKHSWYQSLTPLINFDSLWFSFRQKKIWKEKKENKKRNMPFCAVISPGERSFPYRKHSWHRSQGDLEPVVRQTIV